MSVGCVGGRWERGAATGQVRAPLTAALSFCRQRPTARSHTSRSASSLARITSVLSPPSVVVSTVRQRLRSSPASPPARTLVTCHTRRGGEMWAACAALLATRHRAERPPAGLACGRAGGGAARHLGVEHHRRRARVVLVAVVPLEPPRPQHEAPVAPAGAQLPLDHPEPVDRLLLEQALEQHLGGGGGTSGVPRVHDRRGRRRPLRRPLVLLALQPRCESCVALLEHRVGRFARDGRVPGERVDEVGDLGVAGRALLGRPRRRAGERVVFDERRRVGARPSRHPPLPSLLTQIRQLWAGADGGRVASAAVRATPASPLFARRREPARLRSSPRWSMFYATLTSSLPTWPPLNILTSAGANAPMPSSSCSCMTSLPRRSSHQRCEICAAGIGGLSRGRRAG